MPGLPKPVEHTLALVYQEYLDRDSMSSSIPFSSPYMSYQYQMNAPNMSQAYSLPNSVIHPHVIPISPPQQQPSHHSAAHQSASQQPSTQNESTQETQTQNESTPITPGTLPLTGTIPRALMIPPPEASFPTLEDLRSSCETWAAERGYRLTKNGAAGRLSLYVCTRAGRMKNTR